VGAREVIEPLMGVRPCFLDAAQGAMHDEYGQVEADISEHNVPLKQARWSHHRLT
jgi:hypothetical protein